MVGRKHILQGMIKRPIAGDTIRKKPSLTPWLVVAVFENGWLVTDLMKNENPSNLKVILERDYEYWEADVEVTEERMAKKNKILINLSYTKALKL